VLKKRIFFAIAATVSISAIAVICSAVWDIAAPLQMPVGKPPAELNAQNIEFKSDSGATVHGWWCPLENSRGAVLLLPGMRGNRLQMVDRARFLRRAGYASLLIDLQGTGETKGTHVTFGWKESRDVIAAINFIHQQDPTAPVAIIGSSLGGAASLLAVPPLKPDALILESVYPTIEMATRNRLLIHLGSMGGKLTPLLLRPMHWWLGVSPDQLRPVDHLAEVRCPVFIIAGEKDRHTPPSETKMLFERANPPKELWLMPNVGHYDLCQAAPDEYEKRVLAFLNQMANSR
jgi:uncharacterized protein